MKSYIFYAALITQAVPTLKFYVAEHCICGYETLYAHKSKRVRKYFVYYKAGRIRIMLYIIMLFLIYSFAGCLLEMIYCTLLNLKYESRKCMLIGMLCPVYGIGALSILGFTAPFRGSKTAVFIIGAIAATLAEYITDMFYKEILHVEFWNYSNRFLNINGRVCLTYTVLWGFLSLGLVYYAHPKISILAKSVDSRIAAALAVIFIIDAIASIYLLRRFESKNAINIFMLCRGLVS